jgi:hypothetical protein
MSAGLFWGQIAVVDVTAPVIVTVVVAVTAVEAVGVAATVGVTTAVGTFNAAAGAAVAAAGAAVGAAGAAVGAAGAAVGAADGAAGVQPAATMAIITSTRTNHLDAAFIRSSLLMGTLNSWGMIIDNRQREALLDRRLLEYAYRVHALTLTTRVTLVPA